MAGVYPTESADLQIVAQALNSLDVEECAAVIIAAMERRPEMAPSVVAAAVPAMTYPPSTALTQNRSHGVIKHYDADRGFGFIACDVLHKTFGHDVYLHSQQIRGLKEGQAVSFAVMLSRDNRPQAYDLVPLDDDVAAKAEKSWAAGRSVDAPVVDKSSWASGWSETVLGVAGADGALKTPATWAESTKPVFEKEVVGEFRGTIKRFKNKCDWSFIDAPAVAAMCTEDVFVHKLQIGSFTSGDEVMFTLFINKWGKPQAKDLRAASSVADKSKLIVANPKAKPKALPKALVARPKAGGVAPAMTNTPARLPDLRSKVPAGSIGAIIKKPRLAQ